MRRLGRGGSPILPLPESIGWKNISKIAASYWGKRGTYELWKLSNDKYIIIITSGDELIGTEGAVTNFYHDQTHNFIGRGVFIISFKFDMLELIAEKYRIRRLATYK